MRYLSILFLSACLFAACSGSKNVETQNVQQAPCTNQTKNTNNKFLGETVENFRVVQQGDMVYAEMDVNTTCDAKIGFNVDQKSKEVRLKLNKTGSTAGDCLCKIHVTTNIANLDNGDYDFLVTDNTGYKMLAEQKTTVK
ncbi:MAG TPA: hypothetical protein VFF33_12675 [Ignavibacteriaceae bacterium]|nr:hypothetical protein [Ignavibacteriaceae bacterium]